MKLILTTSSIRKRHFLKLTIILLGRMLFRLSELLPSLNNRCVGLLLPKLLKGRR